MSTTLNRALLVGTLLFSASAQAQENKEVTGEIDAAKSTAATESAAKDKKEGWEKRLSLGSSFALNATKDVAGVAANGRSTVAGVKLNGLLSYRKGPSEWLNELNVNEQFSRGPQDVVRQKSADNLDFKSTYLYSLKKIPWFGPFGRLTVNSSLFPDYIARTVDTTVQTTDADGTVATQVVAANEPLKYNESLEPLLAKEVVGGFASPIDKGVKLKVNFHVGVGAAELFTKENYILADDAATTDVVELKQLQDYTQVGAEFEGAATGALSETISWTAGLNLFQPVYSSITATSGSADLSGTELLNIDAAGKVSVKLNKWASIDFGASARKYPLVSPDWQLTAGFLVTGTFNLI